MSFSHFERSRRRSPEIFLMTRRCSRFAVRSVALRRTRPPSTGRRLQQIERVPSGQDRHLQRSVSFSMPKHTLTGNIKRHRAFPSTILGNRRDVLVYLPRGYRRLSRRRYPVLYLHDGQNIFDAATSFSGVEWGVDETAERLIKESLIEPLIVVAIANMGEQRIHEYAPTPGVID